MHPILLEIAYGGFWPWDVLLLFPCLPLAQQLGSNEDASRGLKCCVVEIYYYYEKKALLTYYRTIDSCCNFQLHDYYDIIIVYTAKQNNKCFDCLVDTLDYRLTAYNNR